MNIRRRNPFAIRSAVAAVALTPILLLTGCTGGGSTSGVEPATGDRVPITLLSNDRTRTDCAAILGRITAAGPRTVIVVDRTASRADGQFLPADLVAELKANSLAGGSVTVVAVNGESEGASPAVPLSLAALSNDADRDAPSVQTIAESVPYCVADAIAAAGPPTAPGTDFYPAVARAAQVVGPETSMWWLTDLAFNSGQLSLASAAVLNEAPESAVEAAATSSPLDLQGVPLHVVGVGNTRSAISPQGQTWLVDYAKGLCAAWHATGCDGIAPVLVRQQDLVGTEGLPDDPALPFPRIEAETGSAQGVPTCQLTIPAALTFEPDSATLRGDVDSALDPAVTIMRESSAATMSVVGHTASVPGSPSSALVEFSTVRAASVKQYFVDRGIPGDRIETLGVGDAQPLAEDLDPSTGRLIEELAAGERRIDIAITGATCPS